MLELLLLVEHVGFLKIGTRVASVRHQLLLAVSAALELGNHGISAVGFLIGATREKNKNSGYHEGDSKQGGDANLQGALKREGVASHLFGDRKGLKSGLCDLAAFVGNTSLLAEFVKGLFFAQLDANAREQLRRVPRQS